MRGGKGKKLFTVANRVCGMERGGADMQNYFFDHEKSLKLYFFEQPGHIFSRLKSFEAKLDM